MNGSSKKLRLIEIIYAKIIARSIEKKFGLFCCGCKVRDQDCLMLDEFEKWEMYGLDAIEEAGINYAVWREFTSVIEILNVPFEKYFTEHLLSLEENPDLMLIESLFQEYRDNQALIEVLCDLSDPRADPLEPVAECLFGSPPTFIYYVRGKGEKFRSKEQDEQKAYQNYL
ncbi:Hypothetical predicted protein [Paramuricea clavata]|uniref:Uncharacterized protein n=1 Tax=Paramuricea clavata TaxID=317549 RepID=A0A6S7JMX8_PARCT|nr:Hypothetical predicted protein [Paramuricea clavata]